MLPTSNIFIAFSQGNIQNFLFGSISLVLREKQTPSRWASSSVPSGPSSTSLPPGGVPKGTVGHGAPRRVFPLGTGVCPDNLLNQELLLLHERTDCLWYIRPLNKIRWPGRCPRASPGLALTEQGAWVSSATHWVSGCWEGCHYNLWHSGLYARKTSHHNFAAY